RTRQGEREPPPPPLHREPTEPAYQRGCALPPLSSFWIFLSSPRTAGTLLDNPSRGNKYLNPREARAAWTNRRASLEADERGVVVRGELPSTRRSPAIACATRGFFEICLLSAGPS